MSRIKLTECFFNPNNYQNIFGSNINMVQQCRHIIIEVGWITCEILHHVNIELDY